MLPRYPALMFGFAAAFAASAAPAPAAPATIAQAWTADSVMARIDARNPSLNSFRAPIHIDGHVKIVFSIPRSLDGTWYFKRPDHSDVVLDNPPSYLKGIKSFIGDILDPAAWKRDSNIAFDGVKSVGGKPMLALRLTKKIYSDQMSDTVAYVDPATFQVVREDFHYRDGSTNTMLLTYRNEGGFIVPSALHGEVHHRMTATLDATIGTYQMNAAFSDAVFSGQQ